MPPFGPALLKRLLRLCHRLYNQIDVSSSAASVVHFCEITLGGPITSANVHAAFLVQHLREPGFTVGPVRRRGTGGTVVELLGSATLASTGITAMPDGAYRWPVWQMSGHVLRNEGRSSGPQAGSGFTSG